MVFIDLESLWPSSKRSSKISVNEIRGSDNVYKFWFDIKCGWMNWRRLIALDVYVIKELQWGRN